MFSYWAYIFIGNDSTGKTTIQRRLVFYLCGRDLQRLPANSTYTVTHRRAPKGLQTLFTANRSYQELAKKKYGSVKNYLAKYFKAADLCVLSSHANANSKAEVEELISGLKSRCYNVAGVFLSNASDANTRQIAELQWDERLWIYNPELRQDDRISTQLDKIARDFSEFLIVRANQNA